MIWRSKHSYGTYCTHNREEEHQINLDSDDQVDLSSPLDLQLLHEASFVFCYSILEQTANLFFSTLTSMLFFSSEGLCPETKQLLSSTSKKKGKGGSKGAGPANEEEPKADFQPVNIHLHFKRYVFDPHKKMVQC